MASRHTGRPATVAQNQTKQIELLKAADVPVKKVFLYDGAPQYRFYGGLNNDASYGSEDSNKKVNVVVEVKNSKENNLGMPLPKGKMRLYKRDEADGSLEFIGEDECVEVTPHTVRLRKVVLDQATRGRQRSRERRDSRV